MLNSLRYFFKRSPARLTIATIAGLLSGASNIALVAVINRSLYRQGDTIAPLLWSFIGIGLFFLTTRFISQVVLNDLGKRTAIDLQVRLTRRILATPLRRLEEVGSHRLISAISQDVSSVTQVATQLPGYCLDLAIIVGCVVYVGWLSLLVQTSVIVFLMAGIAIYKISERRTTPMLMRIRKEENTFFKHLRALIEGNKELKLNRRRRLDHFGRALNATASSITRQAYKIALIFSGVAGWALFVFYTLIAVVVFVMPAYAHVNREVVTGTLLVILILRGPLESVINGFQTLSRSSVALRNIESLGLSEPETSAAGLVTTDDRLPPWDQLELAGVTMSYPAEEGSGRFTLGPLDLVFRPREIVFISGGNGSGKTTLAKLLAGLYFPESGEIRFNHRAVDDSTREQYRQYFAAVFSDFFLFEDLVGGPATDVDLAAGEYLGQLRLTHKVTVANGMLSTTQLSQGQRKRLALLAAYVEDRQIYIFDEWAADQDPEFKDIFYHQLLPKLKARNKTVFVITHDDRYYHVADRIIKLDYGQIDRDLVPEPVAVDWRIASAPASRQSIA